MATHNHEVLKVKALEWLYLNARCQYVATELKIGRYIFDVVGCDGSRVFIIEAKQDKKDYTRELNCPDVIKEKLNELKDEFKKTGEREKYLKSIKKERNKSIKFFDDTLYRFTSHRYIIAPDNVLTEDIIPQHWGLLNEEPRLIKECLGNRIDQKFADKIIRDICNKNTRIYLEMKEGVKFDKVIEFPDLNLI
ncbi:MAG: hypothetical protein ACOC3V_05285 [bacterium]